MGPDSDLIMQSPTVLAPESVLSSSPTHINTTFSHSSQPEMQVIPSPINTSRRRRPSKGAGSAGLKRSASTPNIRKLTAGETAMSLAEKRRNKLGYHRTSVACVHCRRRKIRCLLAPDDPQNRCSNCIRLKKECNFYPVDQQPQVERQPRAGSRTEGHSAGNSASSSSSPGLLIGQAISHSQHPNQYPMLPISAHPYSNSMASMSAGIISPPSSIGPNSSRIFEFPFHQERSNWENPLNDHGPLSAGPPYADDHAHRHWKESPITPGYSPYTTGPPTMLTQQARDAGINFPPFGTSSHAPIWPTPTRSKSLAHVEEYSHQYSNNHYQQPYPIDTRRRASDMHPPSLHNSAHSSNASISDAPGPPMSAPLTSQAVHHFALPPASAWNHHPVQSPMTKMPDFAGWYPDPAQLANVQEEEAGSHFGGEPAILYSSAQH
ncbi:hypothetical protein MMC30_007419 [Trapelia coarctata]|nr:hypothetical protein [Trapelia coarctata]